MAKSYNGVMHLFYDIYTKTKGDWYLIILLIKITCFEQNFATLTRLLGHFRWDKIYSRLLWIFQQVGTCIIKIEFKSDLHGFALSYEFISQPR